MPADDLDAIRVAAQGLQYPSESDTPFDVVRWPAKTGASAIEVIRALAGKRKLDEITADAFFIELTGSEDAEGFKKLKEVLKSKLAGLKVFRLGEGETQVDVYLIGRAPAGDWGAVHTKSIET